MNKTLYSNIIYVWGTHGLQLFQSVIVTLFLPKILGVEEFGYWQLFIFYSQYSGFLHFGLNDGVYLKEGGKKYANLNYTVLGRQLSISIIIQTFILFAIALYGLTLTDKSRTFVIVFCCIFTLVNNTSSYLSMVLQAVNKIKEFSLGRIVENVSFLLLFAFFALHHEHIFQPFIIAYLASKIFNLIYYSYKASSIIKETSWKCPFYFNDYLFNVKNGGILVLSNIASMLILGCGRFMIDVHWGITTFSKVSLIIMMVNFILTFVNQISLVLYPELKQWDESKVLTFYGKAVNVLSLYAPSLFVLYVPFKIFIEIWLPEYSNSTIFLLYLIPFCLFDGKMQLIYNTVYKVNNMVSPLLICNTVSLLLSFSLMLLSIFVVESIPLVVMSMMGAVIVRSLIAELIYTKETKLKFPLSDRLLELLLVVAFIAIYNGFELFTATIIYLIFYLIYYVYRKEFSNK